MKMIKAYNPLWITMKYKENFFEHPSRRHEMIQRFRIMLEPFNRRFQEDVVHPDITKSYQLDAGNDWWIRFNERDLTIVIISTQYDSYALQSLCEFVAYRTGGGCLQTA